MNDIILSTLVPAYLVVVGALLIVYSGQSKYDKTFLWGGASLVVCAMLLP